MKMFKGLLMLVLCTQMISANEWENISWLEKSEPSSMCPRNERACSTRGSTTTSFQQTYDLGTAGRGGGPTFFLIFGLPNYPNVVTVSTNRIFGSTQGDVELTERGLKINKPGNYAVSYEVILAQDVAPSIVVPTFLVRNDTFDPNNTAILGSTESLLSGAITAIQSDGILENVAAGTTLSIVACNGNGVPSFPVTVLGWFINAYRIPPSSN